MPDPKAPTKKQMNVRLPPDLIDAIDARRAERGLSRDEWVSRALTFALDARQTTTRRPRHTGPGQRTAPPPR